MWNRLAVMTGLLLSAIAAQAQPAAPMVTMQEMPDEAFYTHAASCVALFKQQALTLKPQAQGGQSPAKAQMVQLTAWGFGFIGTAYKRGLRNPRADALLAQAEREQSSWPEARRQELATQCEAHAKTIFSDASGIERAVVNNRAAARVDKLLKNP